MKLTTLVKEILVEAEEDQLSAAMGMSFKTLGAEIESNKDELAQDVQQSQAEMNESLGAVAIFGMILAAPKVVELLARGLSALIKTFKKFFVKGGAKSEEDQSQVAKKIIDFTHKWHKAYIKGLNWIFKISGLYKKANITDPAQQLKTATFVYYVIVASLAVYSGVGAIGAFKTAASTTNLGDLSLGALETAMASIKSGEVTQFIAKLGLR
jgi:hypothetical protein